MTIEKRAEYDTSFIGQYQEQEAVRTAAVSAGRAAWVSKIKFELKEEYALAKQMLPKLESALATARTFIKRMEECPQHLVVPQMRNLGVYTTQGTMTIRSGILAYEALTWDQFGDDSPAANYLREHYPYDLKRTLRDWDGKIAALTQLQGEVETIIRNAPESQLSAPEAKNL